MNYERFSAEEFRLEGGAWEMNPETAVIFKASPWMGFQSGELFLPPEGLRTGGGLGTAPMPLFGYFDKVP